MDKFDRRLTSRLESVDRSIKGEKKSRKWKYVLVALHSVLVLINVWGICTDYSIWKVIALACWSACLVFDYYMIKRCNKEIYSLEESKMGIIKNYDPDIWLRVMRQKKLERLENG